MMASTTERCECWMLVLSDSPRTGVSSSSSTRTRPLRNWPGKNSNDEFSNRIKNLSNLRPPGGGGGGIDPTSLKRDMVKSLQIQFTRFIRSQIDRNWFHNRRCKIFQLNGVVWENWISIVISNFFVFGLERGFLSPCLSKFGCDCIGKHQIKADSSNLYKETTTRGRKINSQKRSNR